jgi:hypothetical protein
MEWKYVFFILSLFILPCIILVYFSDDKSQYKEEDKKLNYKAWLSNKFVEPIKILMTIPRFG